MAETTTTTTDTTTDTTDTAVVAPVLSSATVKNTKITLKFDGALDSKAVPAASDFSLLVDGEIVAIHHFKVKGDGVQMFVTGTDKIAGGAIVTLSYTDPSAADDANALQGTDGTDVVTFADFAVTNSGKVKPVKPPKTTKDDKDSSSKAALDNDDAGALAVIGLADTDVFF